MSRTDVLSLAAFNWRLATLTREEFTNLVADLWVARGADVTVDGNVLTVYTSSVSEPKQLHIVYRDTRVPVRRDPSPSRETIDSSDLLVTNVDDDRLRETAAETDTGYVGPERLRRIALYAISRDEANAIFERYFGRSLREKPSRETPTERIEWMVETVDPEFVLLDDLLPHPRRAQKFGSRLSSFLAVVVALSLVTVPFAVHGTNTQLFDQYPSAAMAEQNHSSIGQTGYYPPGIGVSGLVNRTALVERHERVVGNGSYGLILRHDGTRGLLLTTGRLYSARQRVSVSEGGRVRYTVNGSVPPSTIGASPSPFAGRIVVNGGNCTTHVSNETSVRVDLEAVCRRLTNESTTPFSRVTGNYLVRYLDESGSQVQRVVRDDHSMYRVVVTEPPASFAIDVSNYRAMALVSESGAVRLLSVSYEYRYDDERQSAQFSFRFTGLADESVP